MCAKGSKIGSALVVKADVVVYNDGKIEDQSLGPFCCLLVSVHLLEKAHFCAFCGNRGRYSTNLDSYECIPATFLGLFRFSSLIFEQSAVFSNHKKI